MALILLLATVLAAVLMRSRSTPNAAPGRGKFSIQSIVTVKSWKPWQAGLLIGILGGAAYLSSAASGRNYPLGVTHGVMYVQLLATESNLDFCISPQILDPILPHPCLLPPPLQAKKPPCG